MTYFGLCPLILTSDYEKTTMQQLLYVCYVSLCPPAHDVLPLPFCHYVLPSSTMMSSGDHCVLPTYTIISSRYHCVLPTPAIMSSPGQNVLRTLPLCPPHVTYVRDEWERPENFHILGPKCCAYYSVVGRPISFVIFEASNAYLNLLNHFKHYTWEINLD